MDFAAGVVRLEVRTTKSDDGRVFPFDVLPELADCLKRQRLYTDAFEAMSGQPIPWVFHREGRPICAYAPAWKAAVNKAGLANLTPHDFRRSAARNLLRAGVPEVMAMKLCGWRTASVFRRYCIIVEPDLREAVGRLAAANGHKTGTIGGAKT